MRDYDVTSAGISAEQERQHRMKVYFIMMAIRMSCVASLIWVRGWWILVAAIGGVVLPYLAVIIANQPKYTQMASPEQPKQLQLTTTLVQESQPSSPLIVIDEPAERRSSGERYAVGLDELPEVIPEQFRPEAEDR